MKLPSFKLTFMLLALLVCCRRQPKPNVLSYIPPDAPMVAWMPEPKSAFVAIEGFLQTFTGSTLGDQIKALRQDTRRQLGIDLLDPQGYALFGLDVAQPWALAADANNGWVAILAASDPAKFLERFSSLAADQQLQRSQRAQVYVFSQPFGNVTLEQCAVRLDDQAVLVTVGDGGAARLEAWPHREAQNFQKFWKRAGPDGSMPGAVARFYGHDARLGSKAELRSALTVTAHRAEIFTTVLGADTDGLLLANTSPMPGLGFSDKSVAFARSTLRADKLVAIVSRVLPAAAQFLEVASLASLGTGEAALSVEMDPTQLAGKDRLRALLDAFPITATATVSAAPADALKAVQAKLKAHNIGAVFNGQDKLVASTISDRSPATLSHVGNTLTYGVGPGAFDRLVQRIDKKESISATHHAFAPLLEAQTSGVVIDLSAVMANAQQLFPLVFGEQSFFARSIIARTLDSFSRFDVLGASIQFEGPAMGPHPVVRVWLTTK